MPAAWSCRPRKPPTSPWNSGSVDQVSLDLTDRRIYGCVTEEHLRFADVDANGHINNGAFLQLLENARGSYMRQDMRQSLRTSGLPRFRVVVGRLELGFKPPISYPRRPTARARL